MEETCETRYLMKPLSLPQLLNNGTNFEINCDFNDVQDFDDDLLNADEEDDNDNEGQWEGDCEDIVSPWLQSFDELKTKMVKINDHLYKRTTRKGNATKGKVPLNARVRIRYNAYWEKDGAPFDSSYLRGSSFGFYTGQKEVLEGFEQAILTMTEGEQAQFIISYQILFGELGCPPRIRPKADGLFVVEVVEFNLVGNANAELGLSAEDKMNFEIVLKAVKELHLKGLDFFHQKMFKKACLTFQKAVRLLTYCSMKNDEEEKVQTEWLIKLQTNMAICYIKLKQPAKTCIMIRELKQLTNNQLSCKALFQEGRALFMLGDFKEAKKCLLKCMLMEPNNMEISKELIDLDRRYGAYQRQEKELWTRALKVKGMAASHSQVNPPTDKELSPGPDDYMKLLLKEFKMNLSMKELSLPDNLTQGELNELERLTEEMSMKLKITPTSKKTVYSVVRQ